MSCSVCSKTVPPDARFCASCGAALTRMSEDIDPLREILKVALGRQYDIIRLLGRGGMGAVYLAREVSLDRKVAIKVLPSNENHFAEESRERFRREARTAAKLSHPNIVPLHTFGEIDGTLYFVMGYVPGESLRDKLKREGRLGIATARRILDDVARALEYAHSLGIVHRDIKPDNVLIEEGTGRAILTDFGVAKPLESAQTLTFQGSLIGTPHYMSPEQASGAAIDHRSDLYSLGATGFEMLAGRLPFQGKTTSELLVQHMTAEPPTLITVAPDVPVEMSIALTRCLAKQPEERWEDAAEFRSRLLPPEEEDLPQEFGDIREIAKSLVIFPLLVLYAGLWLFFSGAPVEHFYLVVTIGGLAVASPIGMVAWKWSRLRKVGYDHRRIRREALKQPKKFIGWYPRRYRAKGDVWHRLPKSVRRARAWVATFMIGVFLYMFPLLIAFSAMMNGRGAKPRPWVALLFAGGFFPLLAAAYYEAKSRRLLRTAGASQEVLTQFIMAPMSATGFWSKPAVVRLLAPAEEAQGGKRPLGPATPREFLAAIRRNVTAPDFPARELGEKALLAAEQVAGSLVALDNEITALAATSDPAEQERLTLKLSALGGGDAPAHASIRVMLEQQLDAVTKLESRIEEATQKRTERIELLKTLWLHLSALTAADAAVPVTDTVDRVRALCDELRAAATEATASPAKDTRTFSDQATIIRSL